ncbi:MAG: hypothetical protein FWD36_00570 [Treponema sp.]|nr:hypothetical protein [Treponema sp.]
MKKGNVTKRDFRRFLYGGAIVLGAALLVLLVLFLSRPTLLWYVDEDFSAAWNRILRDNAPPFSRYEVQSRPAALEPGDTSFPKGRFGFIVGRNGPEGERADGAPVVMYPNLSRTREYQDWMALALDPWMVFRKHQDPEPDRSFINLHNERGSILLPGADSRAAHAWLCQLLQTAPGVFTSDSRVWQEQGRDLVRDYPFQSGAFSYAWMQVWPLVFRDNTAVLYAPLSQARALAPERSGRLGASRFPEPEHWNRYGLQADILWAKAHNDGKQRRIHQLETAEKWLKDSKTQTFIANTIEWIPAHPSGVPYNTISWETQMAWVRSLFIWQGVNDAHNKE